MLRLERGVKHMTSSTWAANTVDLLAVTDALLRFGAGTDDGDRDLLESAFTTQAVVDFGPCGRKLGLDFGRLEGRETIVGFLSGTSAQQVTSHVVTNGRVRMGQGQATLGALVEATHVVRADPQRRFRMMCRYDAELSPDLADWRIARLVIDNVWFEGDPQVMFER